MDLPFQMAGGSVTGRAHVAAGRNNQDAFAWAAGAGGELVALVCDGCGSGAHSEVGAGLGARLVVQAAARRWRSPLVPAALLAEVLEDVLARLRLLADAMSADGGAGDGFSRTVADHFLFTVVGLLVAGGAATTFSIGDGIIALDGVRLRLGPFPDNEPPYLGYALLPNGGGGRRRPAFQIHHQIAADGFRSLLLGSDGAADLDAAPGVDAGRRLDRLVDDDRCFTNPDMVRRRLTVMSREAGGGGWLSDDTTVVAIRRRAPEREA